MNPNETNPELSILLPAMLDGEMTDAERARLADLLRDDPQAQQVYLDFCWTHALLRRELGVYGEVPFSAAGFSPPSEVYGNSQLNGGVRDIVSSDTRTPSPEAPIPPIVIDLSSTTHYPLPTSYFSVGSWAFSCMVSAVIMVVMLLGLWVCKVNHHQHIAEAPSQSVPSDAMPEMVFVGRITGMVDVKWSDDPYYLPPLSSRAYVPLGRKYILHSGLLEITYASGAKVILEGPCTYEVESTAGGYLALGKLTARIEERREKREEGAQTADSTSSLIPHPSSLFAIRTPTAVITDLGTEFGVEVKESGDSLTHVFKGKVEVRLANSGKENSSAIQLTENESVWVDGNGWEQVLDAGSTADESKSFVRRMPAAPKPSPVKVLAWFRMGDDDPGAAVGAVANEETVDQEGRFTLARLGEPSYSDGEVSVGGRFSVRFHGSPGEGFFDSDALCAIRDNFVIEAWVKVRKFADSTTLIAYNGHTGRDGFGLIVRDGHWQYLFGGIGIFDSGVPVELGEWTHVALVHQWGSARIWVNGRLVGEPVASWRPYPPEGVFQIGGEQSNPRLSIDAEIDEVRLSVLLERFRPEMLLFPASSAPHSPAGEEKGGLPTK